MSTIVITGASSGIGKELVKILTSQKHQVFTTYFKNLTEGNSSGINYQYLNVMDENIELKKGDIAAFASVTGHKYGHIAMYNGTQWVSDFRQNSFWVATAYSKEKKYSMSNKRTC